MFALPPAQATRCQHCALLITVLSLSLAFFAGPASGCNGGGGRADTAVRPDSGGGQADASPVDAGPPPERPDYVLAVRAYHGAGYDDVQFQKMKELGVTHAHCAPVLSWPEIEPSDNDWRWKTVDQSLAHIEASGLKLIPCLVTPKSDGPPWDPSLGRDTAEYRQQFGDYCFEVVNRLRRSPSWSGIVTLWAGDGDIYTGANYRRPEVLVPVNNAGYDAIKRADPRAVVAAFNWCNVEGRASFEAWHRAAFALDPAPKLDWFGNDTSLGLATVSPSGDSIGGLLGQPLIWQLLAESGYGDRPLFQNEGIAFLDSYDGDEIIHAEQVVETQVVARSLGIEFGGWVHYSFFGKTPGGDDEDRAGLLSAVTAEPPLQPRPAFYALKTLLKSAGLLGHVFEAREAGDLDRPEPLVYRFAARDNPAAKLWIIFSPLLAIGQPVTEKEVAVKIAPATQARLIELLGKEKTVDADASGVVKLTARRSPVYLRTGAAKAALPTLLPPVQSR